MSISIRRKTIAIFLSMVCIFGITACSGNTGKKASSGQDSAAESSKVDFSAFPKELNDWNAQNINDYFKAAGVFQEESWIYVQDHATYYTGTVLDEGAGYEDEAGEVTVAVFSFDLNNKDAEKTMKDTAAKKKLPDDLGGIELTHMLGKFCFDYNLTTNEEVYQGMETAFKQLEDHFGIKADF